MKVAGSDINSQFFNSLYKDVWKALIPPGLTEAETDFLLDAAQLAPGDRVLDLMCGYGRHSLALSRRRVAVTAVDNLKEYINEINDTASGEGLPVKAVQENVLEFEPDESYRAVICMGNSIAFFNREETTGLFKKISTHLDHDGVFVINTWMIAEVAIRHFKEKEWYYVNEYKYLLDYTFCFNPNRIESEQTIVTADGAVETLKGVDYIFSLDELQVMLAQAGMRLEAVYSTPRKRPFAMGDGRAYIVARRA